MRASYVDISVELTLAVSYGCYWGNSTRVPLILRISRKLEMEVIILPMTQNPRSLTRSNVLSLTPPTASATTWGLSSTPLRLKP